MTIVSLAIETNLSLNNAVVKYDTPLEAAQRFINDVVLEDGEFINLILASTLDEETNSPEEGQLFAKEVERHFEALAPELFAEGYVWLDE